MTKYEPKLKKKKNSIEPAALFMIAAALLRKAARISMVFSY